MKQSEIEPSEIEDKVNFSIVRYAQVWEDADVLLAGLAVKPGETCLSIASAGDNTLALLAMNPGRVIALDLNPLQLYCLELRVAAYRVLEHPQLLELIGSRPTKDRLAHYRTCRGLLSSGARSFWDTKQNEIAQHGLGGVGKLEGYFRLFRSWVLPLIHSRNTITQLFTPRSVAERQLFFRKHWNTLRWRLLARLFFSQWVVGKLGRDPAFFTYADSNFAAHVTRQIQHVLCTLDPASNPYLHWMLTGTHGLALPFALRAENFDLIRQNLDKLKWQQLSLESFVERCATDGIYIDKFNLSNIFEYMSQANFSTLLARLIDVGTHGARLLYWNMLVPRRCPASLLSRVQPLTALAEQLHALDKAIFYSGLQIEEVL